MSMWNYVFDNDYLQRADIEALKRSANHTSLKLHSATLKEDKRIEQLEQRVGELALLCRGLLTVLNESGAVKPEALHAAMAKIDAEDGVIDGQVTPEEKRPKPPEDKRLPRRPRRLT
jgi:hypothetical protein